MPAQAPETGNLYEIILRVASFPVLLLLIALAWLITNYLMNPRWKQERRNRQIRKAVAARQMLRAEATTVKAGNNAPVNNQYASAASTVNGSTELTEAVPATQILAAPLTEETTVEQISISV